MKSNKVTLCLCLSDNHFGRKVVDPETGEEIYNEAIAGQRLIDIPDKITEIVSNRNIDKVFVLMLGDHIDGEGVYPNQGMQISSNASLQVEKCVDYMWEMLLELERKFNKVVVIGVRGNHGRTGHSNEANWDNVIFAHLDRLTTTSVKNIKVIRRYAGHNVARIKGHRFYMRHKAPKQADTPSAMSKFRGWFSKHDADVICYGHHHHWGAFSLDGKMILRNGTTSEGDDYTEELSLFDSPSQLLFGVTEEHCPLFLAPIYF